MDYASDLYEKGKELALFILDKRRTFILSKIAQQESPPSSFYAFLNQTRKKYFMNYLDLLQVSIKEADRTDLLAEETFQSYSQGRNGFEPADVLSIPRIINRAFMELIAEMVEAGEADSDAGLGASMIIGELLGEAETIRAQSFIQTRDEVIKFYHSYQEEIDRFPDNLAATLDPETLMLSALRKATDLVGADRCAIFSRDLLTNVLHLEVSNFQHQGVLDEGPTKFDESLMNDLVYKGKPVLVKGYQRSVPLVTAIMKKMKTKVLLLVPLMVRGRNVGIMLLENSERPELFTPETTKLAVRFANRVAVSVENARLHGSEQRKLKETIALLEVSRLVSSTLDVDVMLSRLVQITADVCEVVECVAYICMEDGRIYPTASFGILSENGWKPDTKDYIMPSDLSDEEFESLLNQKKLAISDPRLSPFVPDGFSDIVNIETVLTIPIYSRDKLLGVTVLLYSISGDELESEDLNLINAISRQAGVALENASLYEDLEQSYFSTIKALARAIEVKDPYTYGHSEKVTVYAMAIGTRMGLSERELKNLKYASALHDIGKIGIAKKILNKPQSLSDEEFNYVKTHPQLGDSIIELIPFLQESREIILYHHERYDGKGYPEGLKGEDIPLGARILSVADSFEAMMSDRPYRKALPLPEAVSELEIHSGTQFDAVIVKALLDVIAEGGLEEKVETEPSESFESADEIEVE
ncbi:MAG: GAF domain-containing protein [Actinobacteria bacterium]|nr:GAF domain-containing protein [Actinomycetota bacterium]